MIKTEPLVRPTVEIDWSPFVLLSGIHCGAWGYVCHGRFATLEEAIEWGESYLSPIPFGVYDFPNQRWATGDKARVPYSTLMG